MKRTAKALWNGPGMTGTGNLTMQSGVFENQPYDYGSRFVEPGQQKTNPEELIAAAHAGCFAMALSFGLGEEYVPDSLTVDAELDFDQVEGGFEISKITLNLNAQIPNIDEATFTEKANAAKTGCPVSKVLNCEIVLNATLNQ
jgi:osmotically inducible protein OsmC